MAGSEQFFVHSANTQTSTEIYKRKNEKTIYYFQLLNFIYKTKKNVVIKQNI